ncbi:MAG: stalk domain-containing protein [Defluviitaleaceae bacterium]|nr:stalk domain-containing protein [Defluviitaleaceae bacterium]
MKKIFAMTVFLLAFAAGAVSAYANDEIRVTINGEQVEFADQQPTIIDGRTLVPVRAIFEALGATVEWSDEHRTITATTANNNVIRMSIGSINIFMNETLITMDISPQIIDGRTMIPARFVAETVGMHVNWDDKTNTVVITSPPTRVVSVSTGLFGSYAVTNDGSLWDVARGRYIVIEGHRPEDNELVWLTEDEAPVKVMDNVTAVSVGENHAMAIRTDGSLWAWGANFFGQLGDGNGANDIGASLPPEQAVRIMDNVAMVWAGRHHTTALQMDGSLWAWGSNHDGQVGDGTTIDRHTPVRIMEQVTYVSAGSRHTVAIRSDNSLWAWGNNRSGQLGGGRHGVARIEANEVISHNEPSPIRIMDNIVHATASSGLSSFTLAVTTSGDLLFWGEYSFVHPEHNWHSSVDVIEPMRIMSNVAYVFADGDNKMVIQRDGSLWTWRHDIEGRIDTNLDAKSRTFTRIMDDVIAVSSVSNSHELLTAGNTMVILADGTMLAWGYRFGDMPAQILRDVMTVN